MRVVLRLALVFALLGTVWLAAAAGEDESKIKLSPKEKELLDLTNKARKEAKLPPLRPNETLIKVARAHSANMAKQEKLNHDLDCKTPFMRIKEAGYRYSYAGENIAAGTRNVPPAAVFDGWMKSKAHRENILGANFTEIGIGLAVSAKGEIYYTQVFGKPRKKK
jgi:uncharacterized protein YkwD